MQPGRLLLTGLFITGCLGMMAGCSSAPEKNTKTTQAKTTKKPEVVHEYIIKHAPRKSPSQVARALPLPKTSSYTPPKYSAEKNRQVQLRLKRQREWAAKQLADEQRAEYRTKWEQKQAKLKSQQAIAQKASYQQAQAQKTARAQKVAQTKRQQYHQKWQQDQAKRQMYQQQWQAAQKRQTSQQRIASQQRAASQQRRASQQRAASQQRVASRQRAASQQRVASRQRPAAVYPRKQQVRRAQVTKGYGGQGVGNYNAAYLSGDFANNPKLVKFIENMSARHGFSRGYLYGVFSKTRNRDSVARLWAGNGGGSSSGGKGWYNYRSKFVTPANVQKGEKFWRQYHPHLIRASQRYGVDPEYIVGIMGVETRWGRILGKHKVIDALTTSAIVNKRRSRFFFKELENYLLMTRSERMDPLAPKGSYAGAMGYGQFMPSSFRAFAVDFDGDGIRDLWNPVDAIGSIANYFSKHGWKRGQEVAVPAKVTSMAYTSMPDGYKVKYSASRLAKKGIRPRNGRWSRTGRTHLLAFTTVPGGIKEPWIGYHNFYVITRYNHSNYYAMAVHQLAKEVQRQVGAGQYASR